MRYIQVLFGLLVIYTGVFAQSGENVLATANGYQFTAGDLPADIEADYNSFPAKLAKIRQDLLDEQISEVLLEVEANALKITTEQLLEKQVAAKVPDPTEEQIKSIYDANRATIGNKTLEEIRPQIIAFLRQEPQQAAYLKFLTELKAKYPVLPGKDVNAPNLKEFEVLATVGKKQITAADFEARNKLTIYDFEADFYDQIQNELEQAVFTTLVTAEAKAQNLPPGDLLAREITDKQREFSETERENLQNSFAAALFKKYNAKFLLTEPEPVVQNISTDDDPASGPLNATVTVVMFSDFQCSACSAVHPVLKKVLAEYGDRIRFVVRDFPLVAIHENAFRAALAANAANAQGKFFEYTEILYKNQTSLDDASLKRFAAGLGLNIKQFDLDLENEKFADEIKKDMSDGKTYGVTGTPTIFVNGIKVRQLSAASFRKAIDRALTK